MKEHQIPTTPTEQKTVMVFSVSVLSSSCKRARFVAAPDPIDPKGANHDRDPTGILYFGSIAALWRVDSGSTRNHGGPTWPVHRQNHRCDSVLQHQVRPIRTVYIQTAQQTVEVVSATEFNVPEGQSVH